jgi:hypothetical protein
MLPPSPHNPITLYDEGSTGWKVSIAWEKLCIPCFIAILIAFDDFTIIVSDMDGQPAHLCYLICYGTLIVSRCAFLQQVRKMQMLFRATFRGGPARRYGYEKAATKHLQ